MTIDDVRNDCAYSLMLGDCLELMHQLPDKSIDMVLCDLPYGTTACAWDSIIPFDALWAEYKRLAKGAIVLTAAQPFTTKLIASNFDAYKYGWIWRKPQGVDPFMAKVRPLNNIEDVCVFSYDRVIYNPQMSEGTPYTVSRDKKPRDLEITGTKMRPTETVNTGTRLPTRVLDFKQERGLHPTQKPVALFEYLIKTYTHLGAVVLDNCMGSGTTVMAATNCGRHVIGMEKDPTNFEVAAKRVRDAA